MDTSDVIGWVLLGCMFVAFSVAVTGIVRVCALPLEGPVDTTCSVGHTYTVSPVTLGQVVRNGREVGAMV